MSPRTKRVLALGVLLAMFACLQCAEKEGSVGPYLEQEPPQYKIDYVQVMPVRVDPGGTATVQAMLVDLAEVPVQGFELHFSTNYGTIQSSATTNTSGIAAVTYTAPYGLGHANILVSGDGVVPRKVFVQVGEGALSADPVSILGDGISYSELTLDLTDVVSAEDVEHVTVIFSTDYGYITEATVADSAGVVTAILVSEPTVSDLVATVQASIKYDGIDYTEVVYVLMRGVTVSVSADPTEMPADGRSYSDITVWVRETTSGAPLADVEVGMSTSLGKISGLGYTDLGGYVYEHLQSSTTPGVAQVVARYGFLTGTAFVTFGDLTLTIEAEGSRMVADGISSQWITATLVTDENTPVSSVSIDFATTAGVITGSATTDSRGRARAMLTSPDYPTEATITASFNESMSAVTTVTFIDVTVTVEAESPRMAADGVSTQAVTATMISEDNNPVSGVDIRFTASDGVISASATTDGFGQAQAVLTSPDYAASSMIIASFADRVADTTYVSFVGLNLALDAELARMVADGRTTQMVEAVLLTDDGNPVSGVGIDFTTSAGIIARTAVTDVNGKAEALLTSAGSPASAVITGSYRGSYQDQLTVSFEDPVITLTATPIAIGAGPSNSTLVTAYVRFSDGYPVPDNTAVAFSTTEGSITPSAVTSSGIADVNLTPTGVANDNVTVTAYVGKSSSYTTVIFTPDAGANVFAYAVPESLPGDGSATAMIIAEVTDAYGNLVQDGTLVSFSVTSGNGIVTPTALTRSGMATASFIPTGGSRTATVTVSCDCSATDDVILVITSKAAGAIVASPDTAWISVAETWAESQATIIAHVYDSNTNPVEDGTEINFTIEYGPGGGEYLDDPDYGYGPVTKPTFGGMASVTINSGTAAGTVLMRIAADSITATAVRVGITSGPPDSIFINTGDIVRSSMGGEYVLCISGLVRDRYMNPVENGTAVYWTLDRPDVGVINPESFTGGGFPCDDCAEVLNKGVAHACLIFPTSSMTKNYTIIASCGDITSQFPGDVPIVLPVEFAIAASPLTVDGGAGGEVYVGAYLEDDTNTRPITGAVVEFRSAGAGTLSEDYGITDEFGWVYTVLTIAPGTAAGTTTVTASLPILGEERSVDITINP
jgi:adhesin/invasin